MTVEGYPITLEPYKQWRGDNLELELALQNASGDPVAPSGYGTDWASQLRVSVSSTTAIDFAVDDTHVNDPDDPYLLLTLDSEQTTAMSASGYGFDVQASGGADSPFTVWQGKIVMGGEFTRG